MTGTATTPPPRTIPSRPVGSPAIRAALTRFAACMRSHKVNVPPPNLSGKGPLFDMKGVNTTSPQFRVALDQCSKLFASMLKIHPGTGAILGKGNGTGGGGL